MVKKHDFKFWIKATPSPVIYERPCQLKNAKFVQICHHWKYTNLRGAFSTVHTSGVVPRSGLSYPATFQSEATQEGRLSAGCPESLPIFRASSGNVRWLHTPIPVLLKRWKVRSCTLTVPPNPDLRLPRVRRRWKRMSINIPIILNPYPRRLSQANKLMTKTPILRLLI